MTEEEKKALEAELKALEAKKADLEKEISDLDKKRKEDGTMAAVLEKAQAAVKKAEGERDKAQARIKDLEKTINMLLNGKSGGGGDDGSAEAMREAFRKRYRI